MEYLKKRNWMDTGAYLNMRNRRIGTIRKALAMAGDIALCAVALSLIVWAFERIAG
jgi:hypothetical protein